MNNRWRQVRRLRKRENARRIRKIREQINNEETFEKAIKALTDGMNKVSEAVREFVKRYSETTGGEQ